MPKVEECAANLSFEGLSLQPPAMPSGAAELAVMASAAAALNAAAASAAAGQLEAMLSAKLPVPSMEGLLALESMAHVAGAMGIDLAGPNAAMELSLAAGSLNVAAPALGELGAALGPALEPVSGLPLPLSINAAIQAALGIDLAAPGAAAAFEASLAAALEASASLPIGLSVEAAMQLGMAARALNAAMALGFEAGEPESFAAALEASSNLEVPPLLMSPEEMGQVSAGLSDLGLVNQALGGASPEIAAPALEASLAAMAANFDAALEATASMSAEFAATAEAAGQLGAALGAAGAATGPGGSGDMAAAAELGGLPLDGLPTMGDMSLAASLCQSFESATGTPLLSSTPCPNIFCVAGK